MFKKYALTACLLLMCSLYATTASAFDLTVGWEPYADKADILGFKLKIGETAGGPYPTVLTIANPNAVTYTITNFNTTFPKRNYYMVLTAYNSTDESDPSNEAAYTKPLIAPRMIKLSIVGGKTIWVITP